MCHLYKYVPIKNAKDNFLRQIVLNTIFNWLKLIENNNFVGSKYDI